VTFAGWLGVLTAVRQLLAHECRREEEHDDVPGRRAEPTDARSILDEIDALIHAGADELAVAIETVEEMLRASDATAEPFDRARILLALGRVRRRAKQRRKAREALAEALAIFEQTGSRAWADAARAEAARCGVRATTGELTVSEQRVAELVAQGMSNREIAAAAFISPKTVEANLARVYRKLGIRSRAQLAVHIALQAAGSPTPADTCMNHLAECRKCKALPSVGISPIEAVTVTCNYGRRTQCLAGVELPSQSV
jgi:DNA-binding CsgD family transcriptional regulator